jgi:hypothetical protein
MLCVMLRLVRLWLLWWQLVETLDWRRAHSRCHALLVHLLHLLLLQVMLLVILLNLRMVRLMRRLLLLRLMWLLPDVRWWHILRSRWLLHVRIVTYRLVTWELIHLLLRISIRVHRMLGLGLLLLLLHILRRLAIVELLVPDGTGASVDSVARRACVLEVLSILTLLLRWILHVSVAILLLLWLAVEGLPWWHGAPKAHRNCTIPVRGETRRTGCEKVDDGERGWSLCARRM